MLGNKKVGEAIRMYFVISGVVAHFFICFLVSISVIAGILSPNADKPVQPTKARAPLAAKTSTKVSTDVPTNTPKPVSTTPIEYGSVQNPVAIGNYLSLVQNGVSEFSVGILSVKRGQEAWSSIYSANQFNDPPPQDMEYIIAEIYVKHTGNDDEILELNGYSWTVQTNKRIFDWLSPFVCCLAPEFDIKLVKNGEAIGLMAFPVYVNDENPMLILSDKFYFSTK